MEVWEQYPTWRMRHDPATATKAPANCRELGKWEQWYVKEIVSKVMHDSPDPPYWWIRANGFETVRDWRKHSRQYNRLAVEVYLTKDFLRLAGVKLTLNGVIKRFATTKYHARKALARGEALFLENWRAGKFDGIIDPPPPDPGTDVA